MTGRASSTLYEDDLIGRLRGQSDMQATPCPVTLPDHLDYCLGHYHGACQHPNYRQGYVDRRYVEQCPTCRPKVFAQTADPATLSVETLTVGQVRPDWDEYGFEMAGKARSRSTCVRAQIGGAAMTKDHRIVATAYNGAASGLRHCVDLPEPIVFAGHDMHCDHAEDNLVDQLRALFDSIYGLLFSYLPPGMDREGLFRDWVASLDLTIYLVGPRDVCTDCARLMYRAGIRNEPKVRQA